MTQTSTKYTTIRLAYGAGARMALTYLVRLYRTVCSFDH